MDRIYFKDLLLKATGEAVSFARKLLFNRVFDDVNYIVAFNDVHSVAVNCPNAESVVNLLWHDGHVPIWIDIYVYEVKHHVTTVGLHVSEHHVTEYADTYYADRGSGPFGVKSPVIPPPISWLTDGQAHRFFIGYTWFQWQLNCLIFRWWVFWKGSNAFNMRFYKENRWKRPKRLEVRYVRYEHGVDKESIHSMCRKEIGKCTH